MHILQMNTGLFPDADTVENAIVSYVGQEAIIKMDIRDLNPGDSERWADVAKSVLDCDRVITL